MLSLSLFVTVLGCAEHDFKGAAKPAAASKTQDAVPETTIETVKTPKLVDKTQEFNIQKTSTPLDVLWVIDNSGSMGEEVAQVRTNFDLFMKSISARADVKLTLISAVGTAGTQMKLDQAHIDKGHQQVPVNVASNNLMDIAAASLCDVSETEVTPTAAGLETDKLCGLPLVKTSMGNKGQINLARGTFKSQLRPGSKKVVIFVTDDDEKWMINADNFVSATKLDSKELSVFAFRGDVSQTGCQISKKGLAFEALATLTKGSVFDICEKDWSANFATLTNSLVKLAATSFALTDAKGFVKVSKVMVGAVELTPSQYVVTGTSVELKDDMAALAATTLTIYYQVSQ